MRVEEESTKQTGGTSPPIRRSGVVVRGTKAVDGSRSRGSRSGVSGTSSMVSVGPFAVPSPSLLYYGELSKTKRASIRRHALHSSLYRWIEVDRAPRRGVPLNYPCLKHQEAIAFSPDCLGLSSSVPHPTLLDPKAQGLREGFHPGYQSSRIHISS